MTKGLLEIWIDSAAFVKKIRIFYLFSVSWKLDSCEDTQWMNDLLLKVSLSLSPTMKGSFRVESLYFVSMNNVKLRILKFFYCIDCWNLWRHFLSLHLNLACSVHLEVCGWAPSWPWSRLGQPLETQIIRRHCTNLIHIHPVWQVMSPPLK